MHRQEPLHRELACSRRMPQGTLAATAVPPWPTLCTAHVGSAGQQSRHVQQGRGPLRTALAAEERTGSFKFIHSKGGRGGGGQKAPQAKTGLSLVPYGGRHQSVHVRCQRSSPPANTLLPTSHPPNGQRLWTQLPHRLERSYEGPHLQYWRRALRVAASRQLCQPSKHLAPAIVRRGLGRRRLGRRRLGHRRLVQAAAAARGHARAAAANGTARRPLLPLLLLGALLRPCSRER